MHFAIFGSLVPFFATAIPQELLNTPPGVLRSGAQKCLGHAVGPNPNYRVNPYEFLALLQPMLTKKAIEL